MYSLAIEFWPVLLMVMKFCALPLAFMLFGAIKSHAQGIRLTTDNPTGSGNFNVNTNPTRILGAIYNTGTSSSRSEWYLDSCQYSKFDSTKNNGDLASQDGLLWINSKGWLKRSPKSAIITSAFLISTLGNTYATPTDISGLSTRITNDSTNLKNNYLLSSTAATIYVAKPALNDSMAAVSLALASKMDKPTSGGTDKYVINPDGTLYVASPVSYTGDYNDLINKPTIPTNTNQLTNGAGYLTNTTGDARYPQLSGSYNNPSWINNLAYSKLTGAPTNVSFFTNDAGYITSSSLAPYKLISDSIGKSGYATRYSLYKAIDSVQNNIPTNNNQISNGANYITASALSPYSTSSAIAATYEPIISATNLTKGYWNRYKQFVTFNTDSVGVEGSTNLWWTAARFNTAFGTKSTTDLAEGTNLYYTSTRFNTAFSTKTTDNLAEGSTNLYWTNSRFDTRLGTNIGTTIQPYSSNLAVYATITPSSNIQSLLSASNYAAVKTQLSLNNVENTALSTWVGSTNLTTLGTVSTGVWNGTAIADANIASSGAWNAKQAALVSGTNIKTINSTSILGSGNLLIDKTSVGLGNVPNLDATNPANIIQTSSYRFATDAEKTTWNGKQDALVSGTNIKTVNGNSLLGSGNVSISGVTSVATGYGLTGGPITSTGTVVLDSSVIAAKTFVAANYLPSVMTYGTGTSTNGSAVTINTQRGKINLSGTGSILNILANGSLTVTLNNSLITSTSTVVPNINGSGAGITIGLNCVVQSQTTGSCVIQILNLSLLSTININGKLIDFVIFN